MVTKMPPLNRYFPLVGLETRLSWVGPSCYLFDTYWNVKGWNFWNMQYVECNLRNWETTLGQPLKTNCKIVLRKAAAPNHVKCSLEINEAIEKTTRKSTELHSLNIVRKTTISTQKAPPLLEVHAPLSSAGAASKDGPCAEVPWRPIFILFHSSVPELDTWLGVILVTLPQWVLSCSYQLDTCYERRNER